MLPRIPSFYFQINSNLYNYLPNKIDVHVVFTRVHLENENRVIIACNIEKYIGFYLVRKGLRISDKTAFSCARPCHSLFLLVSTANFFNPSLWENDSRCWRIDGLKESIEVDSSTMELWTCYAPGTQWFPKLLTLLIKLQQHSEALLF